jgi:hypothetical protein
MNLKRDTVHYNIFVVLYINMYNIVNIEYIPSIMYVLDSKMKLNT